MTADRVATSEALRIYDQLRSAHLERLSRMAPAAMWYGGTRSDFDESIVDPDNPPEHRSRRSMLVDLALRHRRVIEVNEPAMPEQWPFLLPLAAIVRLRSLVSRRRTSIVAYCIENADPAAKAARRWHLPRWLALPVTRVAMWLLVASTDRLAFGTSGARARYADVVGDAVLARRSRTFEALPSACGCGDLDAERPEQVIFVGSFVERKGIEQLMAAWPLLHEQRPTARLVVIGAGRLQPQVESWAQGRPEVELVIDPPRTEIHRELRRSRVLVLLSQPVGGWREQIGLPIVEGLSHGCEIVTTTETGIADWLRRHDHEVDDPAAPPSCTADRIAAALTRADQRRGSRSELPGLDQRLEADRWLMGDAHP